MLRGRSARCPGAGAGRPGSGPTCSPPGQEASTARGEPDVRSARDADLQEFLEVRRPGVDYEEHQHDVFAIQLGVDLENFKSFPRVDDNVTYAKQGRDHRSDIRVDESPESP